MKTVPSPVQSFLSRSWTTRPKSGELGGTEERGREARAPPTREEHPQGLERRSKEYSRGSGAAERETLAPRDPSGGPTPRRECSPGAGGAPEGAQGGQPQAEKLTPVYRRTRQMSEVVERGIVFVGRSERSRPPYLYVNRGDIPLFRSINQTRLIRTKE